ncbi:hypothetical protein E1298_46165 [Actinomadura rubrisoli]|uniref:Uncharacterized protein n=2 Tax=Actinomadura rubrisoli TaxID=2530368 RepID=A0A4R4ZQB6_9ACTN|nr:hypothetical protein E1298_46165 [Actinomadura rubrisoli]
MTDAPIKTTLARHPHAYPRLAALQSRLETYRLEMILQASSLIVINPRGTGCTARYTRLADTITCCPRQDDGGRLWFFTSWNDPIAEAERVVDAAVAIAGYLRVQADVTE